MPNVLNLEKSEKQQRNKTSYDIINNKSNKRVLKNLLYMFFFAKKFIFFVSFICETQKKQTTKEDEEKIHIRKN